MSIQNTLTQLRDTDDLRAAALEFFAAIGYQSPKTFAFPPLTFDEYVDALQSETLDGARAHSEEWKALHLLFQFTADELGAHQTLFESAARRDLFEAFVFIALDLRGDAYSRSDLASIARELNKPFESPVIVLFRHGTSVTLASVARREHKIQTGAHVLEKVTLLKDIQTQQTHRAHLDILDELSGAKMGAHNWTEFLARWNAVLDLSELNKKFYRELSNWFFAAREHARFPDTGDNATERGLIRLITRLIFTWFLKEKGELVPNALFESASIQKLLKHSAPDDTTYYRAVLQNLFFATLNTEMNERRFRKDKGGAHGQSGDYGLSSFFRYESEFREPEKWLELVKDVPFLNGGLFECLDPEDKDGARIDGFSDVAARQAQLPNFLFWGDKFPSDLSDVYDDKRLKAVSVTPLLPLLHAYKFTIDENTPLEEDVALDPELLGKVFENLLASYNPETKTTARKQTGSFYTPREIVSYMVEEALFAYLEPTLPTNAPQVLAAPIAGTQNTLQVLAASAQPLRALLSDTDARTAQALGLDEAHIEKLVAAIERCTILDPACGSGAFPMGALSKMVLLLRKLDPHNNLWRAAQLKAIAQRLQADNASVDARAQAQRDTAAVFEDNDPDYARKLYLIERCLFGVDIQPVALQIAKLRFFIALIINQKIVDDADNRNIRALPNLETKFVCANTLIALPDVRQLPHEDLPQLEKELAQVRRKHIAPKTRAEKKKLEARDKYLRGEIERVMHEMGYADDFITPIVKWNPYDQNAVAPFFEPERMFGPELKAGFDIVIGNPPYIDSENMTSTDSELRATIQSSYSMTKGNWDIYIAFYEKGFGLLSKNGILSFVTPDKWISKPFGDEMRRQTNDKIVSILKAGRKVFESVNVDAIVTVFINRPQLQLHIYDFENKEVALKRVIEKKTLKPPYAYDWLFSDFFGLFDKIESHKGKLSDQALCENACATSDAYKLKDFVQEGPNTEAQSKFLRIINTGTIGKYVSKWGHREMVYLGQRYLRPVVNKRNFLNEFQNSYGRKSVKPKLIVKGLNLLDACLDADGTVIPGKTTLMISSENLATLKVLLAIINSKVAFFYLKEKYPASSYNQGTTFTKDMINNFPIPNATPEQQQVLAGKVEAILSAKANAAAADTSRLEAEIDELVADLYGLDDDERKLVGLA